MPQMVRGFDLGESLKRAEVEELFAPGTLIAHRGRAHRIKALRTGPDLLGTVETDNSLWITFELAKAAINVRNGMHSLKEGGWRILDEDAGDLDDYVACTVCGTFVEVDSFAHHGAFVEDADFCSEACRDEHLDERTAGGSA